MTDAEKVEVVKVRLAGIWSKVRLSIRTHIGQVCRDKVKLHTYKKVPPKKL